MDASLNNILVITRVSRLDFLELITGNVREFAREMNKQNMNVIWGIGIDTNKIPPRELKRIKDIITFEGEPNNMHTFWVDSFSTNALYGSNIANRVWSHYLGLPLTNDRAKSYVYLLDDDNAIHDKLHEMIENCHGPELITCNQLRLRDNGDVKITMELNADNCLGWIDSAQFLIRQDVLEELGGYEDGYCIDGLTIKKYFQCTEHPNHLTFGRRAAYYNFYTELSPNGMY